MPRPFLPKVCLCGEKLFSFKAKLRHQATCSPVREQRRRNAAAEDYRLVVTYTVKGTDEADVVRRFSAERTHVDGWLTLVEKIEVDEQ